MSYAHAELALLASNDKKLFLKHFKEAMKDDKKVVNNLELTTVARDSLNKLFSKNRNRLRKIYKKFI